MADNTIEKGEDTSNNDDSSNASSSGNQKKKLKLPDKPEWMLHDLQGTYRIIYQECVPDNEKTLYIGDAHTAGDDKDHNNKKPYQCFNRKDPVQLVFQDDEDEGKGKGKGKSAVISYVEKKKDHNYWYPIGNISNGTSVYETTHWLQECEWRPCKEGLKDKDIRIFFYKLFLFSEELGEHDSNNFDQNFIEFTIDGNFENRICFEWEHFDNEVFQQFPSSCLQAHLHLASRHYVYGPPVVCAYILCREDDVEKVQNIILEALQDD